MDLWLHEQLFESERCGGKEGEKPIGGRDSEDPQVGPFEPKWWQPIIR